MCDVQAEAGCSGLSRDTLELPGHNTLTSHLKQTTDNYKLSFVYTQSKIYEADVDLYNKVLEKYFICAIIMTVQI